MQVIQSNSGKQHVLVTDNPAKYYFRGDKGVVVNEKLPTEIKSKKDNAQLDKASCAHKAEILVVAARDRVLTLGEFYTATEFREVWFIPVRSWLGEEDTNGVPVIKSEEPNGKMKPNILSTMLFRGRTRDEFNELINPLQERAFMDFLNDGAGYDPNQYVTERMATLMTSSLYTFEVAWDKGVKDYAFLNWTVDEAPDELMDLVDCSHKIIEQSHTNPALLQDSVIEKAAVQGGKDAQLDAQNNGNQLEGVGQNSLPSSN